jgi:hypothetical protein
MSGNVNCMTTTKSLAEILKELSYPAEKWQITTCAEIYGADVNARRQLYRLPARSYESVEHILDALPEEHPAY